MSDSMMDRTDRIRALRYAGTPDGISEGDLRAEVDWRKAAGLVRDDFDAAKASRDALFGALDGAEAPKEAEPAAATTEGDGETSGSTTASRTTTTTARTRS